MTVAEADRLLAANTPESFSIEVEVWRHRRSWTRIDGTREPDNVDPEYSVYISSTPIIKAKSKISLADAVKDVLAQLAPPAVAVPPALDATLAAMPEVIPVQEDPTDEDLEAMREVAEVYTPKDWDEEYLEARYPDRAW